MYYIVDVNEFYIWKGVYILFFVFFYVLDYGWMIGIFVMFEYGYIVVDGYVFNYGCINCVVDVFFFKGEVYVGYIDYKVEMDEVGKEKDVYYVNYENEFYKFDVFSIFDGGMMGGGIILFYDFFIIKNVFIMFLVVLLLIFIFNVVVCGYKKNEGKVLLGIQLFFEVFFVFMCDEVIKFMIGEKYYECFQFFVMMLFFFILFCNLLGLVFFFWVV